jgi:serine/threonine-protein kinase
MGFMSPEQLRGEHEDRRTDLWSVGVLLFQLITGKLPFGGKGRGVSAIAMDIAVKEPPDIRQTLTNMKSDVKISEAFSNVVTKALQKCKTLRWFDAMGMRNALENALVPPSCHFYHCFISYRVAAEKNLAKALYERLVAENVGEAKVKVYY